MSFSFLRRKKKRVSIPYETDVGRRVSSLGVCNHGEIKLLCTGVAGVGKSEICQKYVGSQSEELEHLEQVFGTSVFVTVGGILRQYDLEIFDVNLNDIESNIAHYKNRITTCDGFALVYSKENKASYMKLVNLLSDIRHFTNGNMPIIVIGTSSEVEDRRFHKSKGDTLKLKQSHFEIIGQNNEKIHNAFQCLLDQCVARKDSRSK